MKKRFLQFGMTAKAVMIALLIGVAGMMKGYAEWWDFSAICPSGITLYYSIIDATNYYVELTYPNHYEDDGYWEDYELYGNEAIIIPENVEYNGATYTVVSVGDHAFFQCCGSHILSIPNTIASIDEYGFGQSGIYGVLEIPNSVTTIGNYAFLGCSGLTGSLIIPNSVTSIGKSVFSGCNGLTEDLFIPNSIISIGESAFSSSWEHIIVETGNAVYDSRNNCNAIIKTSTNELIRGCKNTTIPETVISIGNGAFSGCDGITSVTLPNSIVAIGNSAFASCSNLTSITIPNSVTTIGNYAFASSGLSSVIIPNSVTNIEERSFYNCSNLVYVNIGNSVTSIGYMAFDSCDNLTSVTISNSVKSIGQSAFGNCGSLSSITIPSSITSIGTASFRNCGSLLTFNILAINPPTLIGPPFNSSLNEDFHIYVPYESVNRYVSVGGRWASYTAYIQPLAYTSISGNNTTTGNWQFIASPISENTAPTEIDDMVPTTGTYDLYRFDQTENAEWRNYKANNFNLVNGQGYLYANAEDVNIIFKGTFNEDETKNVELVYDANATFAGWNLVGNPFPVSAYANRSYYVMNEDGTAIEPVAVSMETAIPVCTGVMMKANNAGETVTFSKTAPSGQNNQGVLQIAVAHANTRGNAVEDKAIVSFNAGDHLEKFVFNKDNATLCIPQGGKDLAIAYAEKVGEMPLNFKAAKNGEYTITVNPEAVEMNYLHLIDNMTGNDIDLLVSPSYSFNAQTTDYASRFCLVFSICEDANGDNGDFAFISNGDIIINGEGMVQVIDMAGHIIVSVDEYTRCIPTAGMTSGVYVLRLINGNDVKTQKIVVR